MGALITGGGSGAVASSAHAGCTRFRMTDPLLTGRSRRALADALGAKDVGGKIPAARWVRAMAFERMVHDEAFVSELLTRAVGLLELDRPTAVRIRSGEDGVESTAAELATAHLAAKHAGEATMLFGLRVPFVSLSGQPATDVRPDFAIVAARTRGQNTRVGSWLIMGDAKDYERVRSRIDDGRMLKGFLQVALGAESAAAWSQLPAGMEVHRYGALAVPRNAYLRPEALVEDLSDHRREVRARVDERVAAFESQGGLELDAAALAAHVAHLEAAYDPGSCSSCSLFRYCRQELRGSEDPTALLVEIGVPPAQRPSVVGLVDGTGVAPPPATPSSLVARLEATLTGLPQSTGRARVDPVGLTGCLYVVAAKSDAAALGVHGIAVLRVDGTDQQPWRPLVFERTNATETRHRIMSLIGGQVREVLQAGHGPVHLVVPDAATADLLVSIADSMAGVELSRLRWERDLAEGREALTFDGEPATIPEPLSDDARTGVSFLLEDDRARAFGLRQATIDLRTILASHVVPGGPAYDAGRLDYLVAWAEASSALNHRAVSDVIADGVHTPGARLSNSLSDAIHDAGRPGERGDAAEYEKLVLDALEYRVDVLLRAVAVLDALTVSRLRDAYRTLEADAQIVWGRRLALQASDLVRFSRTYRYWRNAQVDMLDADRSCRERLGALVDRQVALDRAADPGVRELALATVVSTQPLRLDVASRRLVDGSAVVLLHGPAGAAVEGDGISVTVQASSFKLGGFSIGRLSDPDDELPGLVWHPVVDPGLEVGDEVVVADAEWLNGTYRSGHEIAVPRPSTDALAAPKGDCEAGSYAADPAGHAWCCRPHAVAEAEWSDSIAERRASGQLNPQVWPPVVDEERFDPATGDDGTTTLDPPAMPDGLTTDDLE